MKNKPKITARCFPNQTLPLPAESPQELAQIYVCSWPQN
jgi:hypothetical protein